MRAIEFEGQNDILRAPKGQEHLVYDLPIFKGYDVSDPENIMLSVTSCFELNAEEMVEMNRTGKLYLTFWGRTIHPVMLTTENPITAGIVKENY